MNQFRAVRGIPALIARREPSFLHPPIRRHQWTMTESGHRLLPEYGYPRMCESSATDFLETSMRTVTYESSRSPLTPLWAHPELRRVSVRRFRCAGDVPLLTPKTAPTDPSTLHPAPCEHAAVKKLLLKIGINGVALWVTTLVVSGVKIQVDPNEPNATREKVLTVLIVAVIFAR